LALTVAVELARETNSLDMTVVAATRRPLEAALICHRKFLAGDEEAIRTDTAVWLLAMVTGAEAAIRAWPLALTLFGEIETTTPLILEVAELAAPVIAAIAGADVLPLEIGQPTMVSWLMVATVPVPLDGTPDVTPTEVRSAIDQNPK
jgi:hypothetical protein